MDYKSAMANGGLPIFVASCLKYVVTPREEGWTRHQENAAKHPYKERVVAHKPYFCVSDDPVCGGKVGCAEIFLMPQPPLLTRRGLTLADLVAASARCVSLSLWFL